MRYSVQSQYTGRGTHRRCCAAAGTSATPSTDTSAEHIKDRVEDLTNVHVRGRPPRLAGRINGATSALASVDHSRNASRAGRPSLELGKRFSYGSRQTGKDGVIETILISARCDDVV